MIWGTARKRVQRRGGRSGETGGEGSLYRNALKECDMVRKANLEEESSSSEEESVVGRKGRRNVRVPLKKRSYLNDSGDDLEDTDEED